jgi:hypothetical protein
VIALLCKKIGEKEECNELSVTLPTPEKKIYRKRMRK